MSIHESLVETDDAEIDLQAPADVLKPILGYANPLVDELRLHVDSNGVRYEVVDPANVAMAEIDVPEEAFESFDADETRVGINIGDTLGALRAGRKRHGDMIHFSYANQHLTTTVQRDYDGTEMDLQTGYATIDPDHLRESPNIPDLEYNATATLPRSLLKDVVNAIDDVTDHIRFSAENGDVFVSGESDVSKANAVISDVATEGEADSMFSLNYTKNMIDALTAVGVDEVELSFGEDWPMRVEWSVEWNGADVTGKWFQAPRVQSE